MKNLLEFAPAVADTNRPSPVPIVDHYSSPVRSNELFKFFDCELSDRAATNVLDHIKNVIPSNLLIRQYECIDLLHRFDVHNIAVAKVRACPAFIAKGVVVDPFQVVDKPAGFDK